MLNNCMRFKALILACLLIFSTAFSLLSSCKKDGSNKTDETFNEGQQNGTQAEDSNAQEELSDNLPERDFGGETVNFYLGYIGYKTGLVAEEENGDLINDAVYKRNQEIEKRFNVKLKFVDGFGSTGEQQALATSYIKSMIQANDPTHDVYFHVQHSGMPEMVLEGYFVNWKDLQYVDLTKPWWFKNITRDLCFADKAYYMTGDYGLYVSSTNCLVFNKNLMDNLGIEYPYQLVLDHKWTFDEFKKMVDAAAYDINGDGAFDQATDRLGFNGWMPEVLSALYVGMGGTPIVKNASNMPELNINNERTYDIADKIVSLYADKKSAHVEASTYGTHITQFKEGRLLFMDTFLSGVTGLKDMKDDFGIVPFPMLDEAQGEYFSRTSNMAGLCYIPVTNTNLEKTGIILEALAAASYKELTPKYFDVVLTVKNTRDVESEEMLKIIKNSARYLYDGFIGGGNFYKYINQGQNMLASDYASNESVYTEKLNKIASFYNK